jgi:hypothetical protein
MEVLLRQRPYLVAFDAQHSSCSPASVRLSRACACCGGTFSRLPSSPLVFARRPANCLAECAIEAGLREELAVNGNMAHSTKIFEEGIDALAHDKVS